MSDFFIEDETKKVQKPKTKLVPKNYLTIKLSSNGLLGNPSKIHVKNYSGQDALDLAMSSEDDILETLLSVLQNMIYEEDVKVTDLHEKDLEEIMLNIYFNFWSPILEYPYIPLEEELKTLPKKRREAIEKGQEKLVVNIRAQMIKTDLLKDFEEPISVNIEGIDYGFILPRVGHSLISKTETEDYFMDQEDELYEVQQKLEQNHLSQERGEPFKYKIKPSERKKFEKYQQNRLKYFARKQQTQLIYSVDGRVIPEDEKIEVYNNIPLTAWKEFNLIVKEKLNFGVQNEIEIKSPITQEKVIRRFQFRFLDFLPSMDT